MATMIPSGVRDFKTEGERQFYRFLEAVAKPDRKYTTWYLPDIQGKEPDFILFCEEVGLVIFEVKDWALDQIEAASPVDFMLRMGREKRPLKNPLRQARGYFESLMKRMRTDGTLLSTDADHYGKPKVPVDYGVVFPNIYKEAYCQKGLDKVIDPRRVFFWDDLHLASDICRDSSGDCFANALLEMFPPRFPFKITRSEYHHLKQLIFPVVRVDHSPRDTCAYFDPSGRANALGDEQEAIARRCCAGHHIIRGPSGTGKTLMLVNKAVFLKQYKEDVRSVLFLCGNTALVGYIKRLLSDKGAALGPGGIEVLSFVDLCSKLSGVETDQGLEQEDPDYRRLLAEEALSRLRADSVQYDAILIDEGHEMPDEMMRVTSALLNPTTNNLTIARDDDLSQEAPSFSWRETSGGSHGMVDEISAVYRNTWEIHRFVRKFLGREMEPSAGDGADHCVSHGPDPDLRRLAGMEELLAFTADTVKRLYDRGEYPLSEFAILYVPSSSGEEESRNLAQRLMAALDSKGILSQWFSQDLRAMRSYDITTERVAIADVHSARGLDYACVFLVGLENLDEHNLSQEAVRRTIYLALTRARHRLFIPFVEQTQSIQRLSACL